MTTTKIGWQRLTLFSKFQCVKLFSFWLSGLACLSHNLQPLKAEVNNLGKIPKQLQQPLNLPQNSESLLNVSPASSLLPTPPNIPQSIIVKKFKVIGSTVFTQQELAAATAFYQNRPLSLSELFQARSAITKLYSDRGYLNSGAYIPPQELQNGVVTIAIKEGELEGINVTGTKRLNPNYIVSRLQTAGQTPVKVEALLEALQMLRLNPLIKNISAELSAGVRPGTSLLEVQIEEADAFSVETTFDNARSPSVGTNRRQIGLTHKNLFGFGDQFSFGYTNTDGSDAIDLAYALPLNPKNGTLKLAYGNNSNNVIEKPFNPLDIESLSRYYELSWRQPLINRPNQELALGFSFSRQESETSLLDIPFALSRGADEAGKTKISALRLFQELVNRDEQQVFALSSQFSIGLDWFNATSNEDLQTYVAFDSNLGDVSSPDSTFFAWRGQSQWVRRLDEDFLLLLRGDLQLATTALVPLEQFRLGGVDSVRGYRQDLLLGDNGLFASAELRIPLFRVQKLDGIMQLTPFFDLGTVWNSDDVPIEQDFLSAVGIGLNFSAGNRLNARLDWGIPLVNLENSGNSLQENGVYFSINYNFL
ncbi:surface antigen (D15) [Stanieria cyanosphaera PCC 7437]|uniref:Surface antigen (D15) n=1 Tax=Stanieria cyanosphaera (strain ATCC 29371 / PCC 7437) TaxID=111780 RepID=K9XYG0_STAC7|nr:ShlB/FhaC/HecB family hemolysin secretion/activation protein [Stanieria cyanosphaera]AFZ37635.1 surface antigen (D15) [Stanieria cyanosphaera PCC 7437]